MSLRRELARKLLHVSTAVVPVAYAAGLDRRAVAGGLGALLVVALVVEWLRARSAAARERFTRATGELLRAHEHAGAWAGATWLLLAFLVATLAFPREVAVAAMLGVSLGDAAGAVVGRWWGEKRGTGNGERGTKDVGGMRPGLPHPPAPFPAPGIAHAPKTFAGTFACAVATALGALLVARLPATEAVLAGVLAAAAERPRIRLDDNLRVTVAVGIGILLWRLAFS